MGSVITGLPNMYDYTDPFGISTSKQMTYVQFVPGVVVNSVTSVYTTECEGDLSRIGSIKALPHITGKGLKKKSMVGEEHRYYPLFRGMQEVPTVGDPVLLATFGGRQYYIGPLNTEGHPNFNEDMFEYDELRSGLEDGVNLKHETKSPMFIRTKHQRLQKAIKHNLDNPLNPVFINDQIAGDLIFEGRHGNSIRIGSRNQNPNIIFSNGRSEETSVETSLDTSIMGMFSHGTIRDHFVREHKSKKGSARNDKEKLIKYKFNLGDIEASTNSPKFSLPSLSPNDSSKENVINIETTFEHYLGRGGSSKKNKKEDVPITAQIHNWSAPQTLLSSDRITFNAREDSIFISAFKHIHMGCGSSMTFSTQKNIFARAGERVNIETGTFQVNAVDKVFIDAPNLIQLGYPTDSNNQQVQPAVMGQSLVTYMQKLLFELQNLCQNVVLAIEDGTVGGAQDELDESKDAFFDMMKDENLKKIICSETVKLKK